MVCISTTDLAGASTAPRAIASEKQLACARDSLFEKKQKITRLLNIIDNSALQDKLSIKIRHETFLKYREDAYEMLRSGYKIALIADETIDTDRAELEKLKMFKYILINKDAPYYEEITRKKRLQNIIEI